MNFKKYRICFWLPGFICLFLIAFCSNSKKETQSLEFDDQTQFPGFKLHKLTDITLPYGQFCKPFSDGLICLDVMDVARTQYKVLKYDFHGNLIKERILSSGQGPDQIFAINEHLIWNSADGKLIFFIDSGYLKVLNPESLEIDTMLKLSNKVKAYGSKFNFRALDFNSIERYEDNFVSAVQLPGWRLKGSYYLVRFRDNFDDFTIISSMKKKILKPDLEKLKKKIVVVDYFELMRRAILFSVDWKRNRVYVIPEIENRRIVSMDLSGKDIVSYSLEIDNRDLTLDERALREHFKWATASRPRILANQWKTQIYEQEFSPPLRCLKIIDDRLYIVTGIRNWEQEKNKVFVYRIPEMIYEGNFYIPYPNGPFLLPKWEDPYYIFSNLRLIDGDYQVVFSVYKREGQK